MTATIGDLATAMGTVAAGAMTRLGFIGSITDQTEEFLRRAFGRASLFAFWGGISIGIIKSRRIAHRKVLLKNSVI